MWSKLQINMSNTTVEKLPLDESLRELGGRALIAQYLIQNVPPTCDPMGEQNVLVFCTPIFAGTIFTTGNRVSVGCKSPLTGGIKESSVGGTFGQFMSDQGFKLITVHGLAPKAGGLHFLHIDAQGKTELVDAAEYKNFGTYAFVDAMRQRYGDKISAAVIGPAGERKYKAASIQVTEFGTGHPSRAAARGGVGGLMGAKGLKAIVIEKAQTKFAIDYADEKLFSDTVKELNKLVAENAQKDPFHQFGTIATIEATGLNGVLPVENFSGKLFRDYKKVGVETFMTNIATRGGANKKPCQAGCMVQCSNVYNDKDGKYITSGFEYETIALLGPNCRIADLDKIAMMDRACDDIGVDTIEMGDAMAVAMECGKIKWGDADAVLGLLEEVRQGTEFGAVIGNGCESVGLKLGCAHIPVVKHQSLSGYDPRNTKGTGATYATCPQGADHTAALTMGRAFDDCARTAQTAASKKLQTAICFSDSMMCLFALSNLLAKAPLLARLIAGLYGGPVDPTRFTINLGAKTLLTERAYNKMAGFTEEDNKLPAYFYTERAPSTGSVFDIDPYEMEVMLDF